MTRAVYIDATRSEVLDMCVRIDIPIMVIEGLQAGGMRAVLHNDHDAEILSTAFKDKLLTGTNRRRALAWDRIKAGNQRSS